jgi:hypothetical protein
MMMMMMMMMPTASPHVKHVTDVHHKCTLNRLCPDKFPRPLIHNLQRCVVLILIHDCQAAIVCVLPTSDRSLHATRRPSRRIANHPHNPEAVIRKAPIEHVLLQLKRHSHAPHDSLAKLQHLGNILSVRLLEPLHFFVCWQIIAAVYEGCQFGVVLDYTSKVALQRWSSIVWGPGFRGTSYQIQSGLRVEGWGFGISGA